MKLLCLLLLVLNLGLSPSRAVLRQGLAVRSSQSSKADPLLGAVVFGEEYLTNSVTRLSTALAKSNQELASLQTSLQQYQAPVAGLSTSANYNLGVVTGNTATIAKAAASITGLTTTGGKLSVAVARLVAVNKTAKTLSTDLAGASKETAPPPGNLSQRIFKANETLLVNGTLLARRLDDFGSLQARLRDNVSSLAGKIMHRIVETELAKPPLQLANDVQAILDAKPCTSNCSSAFMHCFGYKKTSAGGLLKAKGAYHFCRTGLDHGNQTNMTSHGCSPYCEDTEDMYAAIPKIPITNSSSER